MSLPTWTPSWAGSSTAAGDSPSTPSLTSWSSETRSCATPRPSLDAEQGDLRRAQVKAEADVEQVRTRIDRDRQRLDAGQVSSPRDLENLQSEIASLARRQSDLEEIVLDVMERQETAQGRREAAAAERAEIAGERDVVTARRDAALGEIGEQAGKAADRRATVAGQEPADLLDLYERMREQHGGRRGRRAARAAGARAATSP